MKLYCNVARDLIDALLPRFTSFVSVFRGKLYSLVEEMFTSLVDHIALTFTHQKQSPVTKYVL